MSKLQEVAKRESQIKQTENGAMAYNTTTNNLVDLFGTIGALRTRSEQEIRNKFIDAFNEDRLLATKMLFYAGNIRGGLGERRTFRICLKWLAQIHPDIVRKNLKNIPVFNRWDSLFVLVDTPVESAMWDLVMDQLIEDMLNYREDKSITLLAKWMPSENASSTETRKLARRAIKYMNITPRKYRKMLSKLRKRINVVETLMSSNNWDKINYEGVPSRAMLNYNDAFNRHDKGRFDEYIEDLNNGKKKINASILYPYNLVEKYLYNGFIEENKEQIIEQQWKALPNYVEKQSNVLVMADVSGSMWGRPMATSIGLAVYFAERNTGPLENTYMTFTDKPHFQYINKDDSLKKKVDKVKDTDVGYSTNLEAAFDYLLEAAINFKFTKEDMPKAICVISDMEIDRYMKPQDYFGSIFYQNWNWNWDFIETQKLKYAAAGYELPKMILWNVQSRQDTFLSQSEDVIFVSGQSPSMFKQLIGDLNGVTSYDLMLQTLNDKMYDCVVV